MGRVLGAFVTAVFVVVLVINVNPPPASACSCTGELMTEYPEEVVLLFLGRQVDRVEYDEERDNGVGLRFEVDTVFKGSAPAEIEVFTHAQESACGTDFARSGTVGVAVNEFVGELSVGLCGSEIPVDQLAAFGDGYPPEEVAGSEAESDSTAAADSSTTDSGESDAPNLVRVLVIAVVIGVGIGVVLGRSRRK